ncbi:MAG: diguanylate cyclase [Firmicutes bacterium]|nr:diguanylate cyclase [Bacillota bacterium]
MKEFITAFRQLNPGEKVIVVVRVLFILWMLVEVYVFCAICPTPYTPWAILLYLIVTCILMPLWEEESNRRKFILSVLDVLSVSVLFLSLGNPLQVAVFLFYIAVVWGARFLPVKAAVAYTTAIYLLFTGLAWNERGLSFSFLAHFLAMLGLAIYTSFFSETIRQIQKEKHKRELLVRELKNSFQEQTAAARELEKMNAELKKRTQSLEEYQNELLRRNQELALLTEVLKSTTATLDKTKLLNHTMQKTIELFGVDAAFFALVGEEGDIDDIQVSECCCLDPGDCIQLAKIMLPVLVETKEVLVWRYRETPPVAGTQNYFLNHGINAFLATPLVVSEEVVGMMGFFNCYFTNAIQEKEFFTMVSSQLSLALEKAKLYEHLKKQAITDGLTSLYNVRHFKDRLREEIAKVDRKGSCLSLLMIDIDWFKEFNDTFGHQTGDALLCKVAKTLTENVREGDLVARYGGEEFTVILSDTPHQEALLLAERLRTRFKEEQAKEHAQFGREVTLSIGVASYPEHALSVNELVELADRAMYRAKALGKDRVCSITELD